LTGTKGDNIAAFFETSERCFERVAMVAFDAEFADQLFKIGAAVREAGDVSQQRGVGHGFIVT